MAVPFSFFPVQDHFIEVHYVWTKFSPGQGKEKKETPPLRIIRESLLRSQCYAASLEAQRLRPQQMKLRQCDGDHAVHCSQIHKLGISIFLFLLSSHWPQNTKEKNWPVIGGQERKRKLEMELCGQWTGTRTIQGLANTIPDPHISSFSFLFIMIVRVRELYASHWPVLALTH